jgi:hypothetical protein
MRKGKDGWISLAVAGMALMIAACATSPTEGTDERTKAYDEDGMLGFSNTNPNLPTSPTYHTYAYDQDLVEKTLKDFPDVVNPRIVFDGPVLRLDYDLAGNYTAVEAEQLETRLRDRLMYMLPRYEIVLKGPDRYE